MPKLRVYQLARELNRDNSEIIRELQHMGVPVTSHSNTVEDRLADQLRKKLGVFEGEAPKVLSESLEHDDIVEVVSEVQVEVEPEPVVEELKIHEPVKVEVAPPPPVEPPVVAKVETKPAPPPPVVEQKIATPPAPPPPPPPPAPRGVQFVEPRTLVSPIVTPPSPP